MSELEKIRRYIDKTHFCADRYEIMLSEMNTLRSFARQSPVNALLLAFDYGRAKGYRAAKAESKNMKRILGKCPEVV